jgi:hypothetical protein
MPDNLAPLTPVPSHFALDRTSFLDTPDRLLWEVIKDRTEALSFRRYSEFIDRVFASTPTSKAARRMLIGRPAAGGVRLPPGAGLASRMPVDLYRRNLEILRDPNASAELRQAASTQLADMKRRFPDIDSPVEPEPAPQPEPAEPLPPWGEEAHPAPVVQREEPTDFAQLQSRIETYGVFNSDSYSLLKYATEFFVMTEAGRLEDLGQFSPPSTYLDAEFIQQFRDAYLDTLIEEHATPNVLPYLRIIRERLGELPIKGNLQLGAMPETYGILRSRLLSPVMLELIWNYWIEQGMMVQTMNLISLRFQNVRRPDGIDPLANFELDPLRPLSNMLWGYIQDEINRLGVSRRAYEYAHGLGLQLVGKAVPPLHPADVRSMFLPAFHDLLRLAWIFFREDDDKMIVADAFPLLNALRELHFVIAEGAHNQFGDLPMRARSEMLMQQWILGRPEMRDFLRGRTMVPYPESWMDRVDAMKALQGWNDASVINYADLAGFGEKILLAVRYGNWSTTTDQNQAGNWARAFRPEIQRYTHALKVVSGLDLSVGDVVEVRTETERMQRGVVAGRQAQPGGTFSFAAQPVPPAIGARPGAEHLLKQVSPPPARVGAGAVAGAGVTVDGAQRAR